MKNIYKVFVLAFAVFVQTHDCIAEINNNEVGNQAGVQQRTWTEFNATVQKTVKKLYKDWYELRLRELERINREAQSADAEDNWAAQYARDEREVEKLEEERIAKDLIVTWTVAELSLRVIDEVLTEEHATSKKEMPELERCDCDVKKSTAKHAKEAKASKENDKDKQIFEAWISGTFNESHVKKSSEDERAIDNVSAKTQRRARKNVDNWAQKKNDAYVYEKALTAYKKAEDDANTYKEQATVFEVEVLKQQKRDQVQGDQKKSKNSVNMPKTKKSDNVQKKCTIQ